MANQFNTQFKPTRVVGNDYRSDGDLGFKHEVSQCFESYQGKGINLGNNLLDVINNPTARQEFIGNVLESVGSSSIFTAKGMVDEPFYNNYAERMSQLLDNSLTTVAKESAMLGYAPIVAYNPFFLKKAWIDCVYNSVIMTEVPESPVINMAFEKRYLKTLAGVEYEVPDAFYNDSVMAELLAQSTGVSIVETAIPIAGFKAGLNLMGPTYFPGIVANDPAQELTPDLHIFKVTLVDAADTNKEYSVPCNIKTDITTHNFVKGSVKYDVINASTGAVTRTLSDELIGTVNFQTGVVKLVSTTDTVTKVFLRGKLANRFNNRSLNVERRVEQLQYTMPESGPRLNSSITIEDAADALVLQKIDVIADNVDIMGRTLANLEDYEIRSYLDESFTIQETTGVGPQGYDKLTVTGSFNTLPYDGYNGNVTVWMKDAREYFERILGGMKQKLRIQDAIIVAVAHPNTLRFIQDGINWVFTNDTQISGIKISYNFGVYTSAQDRVHFITSMYMPEDAGIKLVLIPLTSEQVTFKHFKYNAVIDRNYLNPLHNLTPNVMCTHRTLTFDVLPVQGKMTITGRDMFSPETLKRA